MDNAPSYPSNESMYHTITKQYLYRIIPQANRKVKCISLEKHVNKRRADILLEENTGKTRNTIIIEIQNSSLRVDELIKRTRDYNELGFYVLWILNPKGPCVASPKSPQNKKNVRISGIEKYLHGMYGGRVYYINIDSINNSPTFTPFALHFSPPDKKKYHKKQFHQKYRTYYIKNAHFMPLPNWNFLCVDFSRFKIARFYDKNVTSVLKNQIISEIQEYKPLSSRKIKKIVLKRFKEKYGKYFVLHTLSSVLKH